MKKDSRIDMEEKEINLDENNGRNKKKLIILIVAILVLSLITTGLTTNIFGRIGTAFRNEGDFVLKHTDENDKETIKNQELKFDTTSLEISLSDTSGKLSYSREKIVPSEYTCETSDAKVATCYPSTDGYVVVYPKGEGTTTVSLRAEANGKIYLATATVTVGEVERYIELASNEGSINLYTNQTKEVAYYLVGMSGKVKATSSDESVAKVSVKDGLVKITASKVGKVDITLSVEYNNQTYTSVYKLEVENVSNNTNQTTSTKKKSRISTLSKLTVSSGELDFNPATTNYSIVVDKELESISINYEKTNANAKVIYTVDGLATTSLQNIPLKDGGKEVIITVISEDGSSTTSYKIAINRADSEMLSTVLGVKISEGKVLGAVSPTSYVATVGSDVDKIDITLDLDDNGSTIRYVVDDEVVSDGSVLKDLNLNLGKNTIKVIIGNKFGINMFYYITIEREAPSNNTNINLDVLDEGYEATQEDDNTYSISGVPYEKDEISLSAACEDIDCKQITFEITYEDGTKKSLDDLNEVPLKEGNNTITITVVAEDGKTTDTYTVNIYRPIRTISFESSENEVLVENEYTDIKYVISEKAEDGTITTIELENPADVMKANLSNYNDDVTLEVHQGFVRVIPKNPKNLVGNDDVLNLNYDGKKVTTNLTFDIDEYELSSESQEYDMSNSNQINTRTIILNTNLVESTDETLSIERSNDGKKLTICDQNKIYCVTVEVDSSNDDGDITLSYGKDSLSEIGPSDLPITLTAEGDGASTIKVSGSVYGKSIDKDFDIVINVTRKYLITISANLPDEDTGKFNIVSKEWIDEISKEEQLDLSLIPEPYKVVDCEYYKFKYYTADPDTLENSYDRDANSVIDGSKLKDDLTLYAVYEDDPTDEEIPETNSIWLKASDYSEGLPLFHNEEYYSRYNEDKVIYPGAEGYYVMNFTAEDAMTLTGMVLKENTICVDDNQCLNMGYMVHYNEIRRADGTYTAIGKDLFGTKSSNDYWILNQNYGIIYDEVSYLDSALEKQQLDTDNRVDIDFDEEIKLDSGDQISITIFWKWVEVDDVADTAIGNYAAEDDNSINEKYGLSVGLVYSPDDTCSTD